VVILLSMPAYCDEIMVQGTELIDEAIHTLEKAKVHLDAAETSLAGILMEQAEESWNSFKEHHAFVYENELTLSVNIDELIAGISSTISDLIFACDEMVEMQDVEPVDAAIEELRALREFCAVPVLFDFTGASCKSCKVMKDRLAAVAEDVKGSVRVVVIDVTSQKDYSRQFKIMLIPTLVFIDRDGKEVDRHVGEMEIQAVIAQLAEMSD